MRDEGAYLCMAGEQNEALCRTQLPPWDLVKASCASPTARASHLDVAFMNGVCLGLVEAVVR